MGRELFGTDGVRGLAGQYPLDSEGTQRIGMAVGTHFAQAGQQVVLACDPRQSSQQLVADITLGLTSVGVDVAFVGVMPTPGLAYLTRERQEFVAGVMVTASHNPYEYNGVKVFDAHGDKLSDNTEAALNSLITNGVPPRSKGNAYPHEQLTAEYEDFLVGSVEGLDLQGLRIAVDSANGAASGLATRVFERLGAAVTSVADQPDGININQACGATDTKALQDLVVANKLDLGVALDGDADRIVLVDQQGRECNGDHIMYTLAVGHGYEGVILTVMSNLGVEQALKQHDIEVQRVSVGDRYVLEGLQATGFQLGGEQSGHIILPQLLKTGDALLAAVQLIRSVVNSGKSLADWRDEVAMLPQALVNFPISDKSRLADNAVTDYVAAQAKVLEGKGRILVRPSGTEPLARVMVEAPNAEAIAEVLATKLQELVA